VHIIDRYAYTNRIRRIDPAYKAGLALLVLVLCLLLNRPGVGLLATGWLWTLATFWAGLPAAVFGRVLLAQALFLIWAVAGVAVSVSASPPLGLDWSWPVGPVWIASSRASLQAALQLATRALGAASAMNFLALTTPLVDLVDLMRRWRLPSLLIDLMTLIYRFIFVLLEGVERMRAAQASRLGYINIRRSLVSAGLLGSRLFIDSYQRSQRLQIALESRGYIGELRVLPSSYRFDRKIVWFGLAIPASLFLAWIIG
jgi:cobalt/nickel transport system permease protein